MSFGAYPAVSITAARKAHEEARKLLASCADPMMPKMEDADEIVEVTSAAHLFRELALDW